MAKLGFGRQFVALCLIALAAFALARPGAAIDAKEDLIVLGTAPVTGVYYPAGGAICRLVNANRQHQGLRCLVESTDGSAENLRRLQAGDLDFALLQSDWQYHAYRGSGGPGTEQPYAELRSVLSLHAQPLTIVAARDSGIDALDQLAGKRVNLGPRGSAIRAASEGLLLALGWDQDRFGEVLDLGVEAQVQALCVGAIDAFVLPTSHPNSLVAAAAEGCQAKLVGVNGVAVAPVLAQWPFYAKAEIPGQIYPGNPDPTPSFGVRATLVTRADVSTEVVYMVAKAVFDELEELKRQHPALASLLREQMMEAAMTAPLHEGAKIYFQEQGWIEPSP